MVDVIEPVPNTLTAAIPTVCVDFVVAISTINVLVGAGIVVLVSVPVTL